MYPKKNILNGLYRTPEKKNWQGRKTDPDKGIQYWHQGIECWHVEDLNKKIPMPDIALIGYACDEGVRRNGGRIGTQQAPHKIRECLAKLPFHAKSKQIIDLGDILCKGNDLEACQQAFSTLITQLLTKSIFPLAIGGGHDIAYAHFLGLWEAVKKTSKHRIGIINFDAHFDLRSVEDKGHSGTPFTQILSECSPDIDYLALGIQPSANTKELYDRAMDLGVHYIPARACETTYFECIKHALNAFVLDKDWIYVTLDMDGFSSAYAPGVSAPSSLGFTPHFIFSMLSHLFATKKVIACDIAETNPNFDQDNITVGLTARIVDFIFSSVI